MLSSILWVLPVQLGEFRAAHSARKRDLRAARNLMHINELPEACKRNATERAGAKGIGNEPPIDAKCMTARPAR